ncbi:MAG: hypothetical protein V4678_04425 [Patescibacteria group bacterium]
MARLLRIFDSAWFFYVSLGLFTLGCIWIATASLYPMAFDEEFHYGLIQIYTSSWLPYGIEHTRDMAQYGAATGDPSYLFHYLMSFPYRLLSLFGTSEWVTIALLRIINVGFVVAALVVFRKVLIEAQLSLRTSNLSLVLFMTVPVLSMLAAQINYDTLLLLVVAFSSLMIVRVTNGMLHSKRIPAIPLWSLVILLLIGMSIKYAFLPIAAALGLWLVGLAVYVWKKHRHTPLQLAASLFNDSRRIGHWRTTILVMLGSLSIFFAAHYVTNIVQYGHPIPDCAVVFDEQACTAYGPWNRNRNYVNGLPDSFQPLTFPAYMAAEWVPGMTERLTFSLAGKTNDFETKQPLPLVLIPFVLFASIGAACLAARIFFARKTISPFIVFSLFVTGIYVAVLSFQLYSEYARTGQPVAINGRYLLLLLPLFAACLIDSVAWATRRLDRRIVAATIIVSLLVLAFGGAGVVTYIIQSEPHWFWPGWGQHSHAVLSDIFTTITIRWQLF